MIQTYGFRLILNRPPTDAEFDELADACSDAGFKTGGPGSGWVAAAEFNRAETSLTGAIVSAIGDIEGHDIAVLRVEPVDLLWWVDIAARVGMGVSDLEDRIAASPIAHSKPMPIEVAPQGSFYHWPDVAGWLAAHGIPQQYDKTLDAVNAALAASPIRTPEHLTRSVRHQLARAEAWQMPEWMEPYRTFIGDHGGNAVEDLLHRLDSEQYLARTNLPVFAIACMAQAQVNLLTRLHRDGCLPPAPNNPGGW